MCYINPYTIYTCTHISCKTYMYVYIVYICIYLERDRDGKKGIAGVRKVSRP